MSRHSAASDRASTLSFWLLVAFLVILWVAGGASRADVLGQAVVRFFAWSILVVAIFTLPRVDWRVVKEPAIILGAAALLVALQLVPLPPSIWTELPGRAIFMEAAVLTGAEQPWRPLSISPSGTSNALASLIVPAVVLLLVANLTREQHWRIAILVLGLVVAGAVLGVLQFSGANYDNPLINTVSGAVAGNFANRNHFALFLAIGVVLAMAWAFRDETLPWKIAVAFGMVVLFILMVLATGSRSGVIVGLAGIVLTFLAFRRRAAQQFKAIPRKIAVPIVFVAIAVLIGAIWLSVGLDRAVSVDRATMLDGQADLRSQIWPIVLEMSQRYFPAGTGFGTFDPVFRIAEPDGLLSPQYINLAHNDWLQLFLEGGLVAGILIAAVLVWYLLKSLRAWSAADANRGARVLAKVGTILIALILAASVTDYPSRTPMVMAILMLASAWLVAPGSKKADTVPTQPSSS
ncbi:O-antigen ligase family protein [Qipengyuania sp. GPGPB31]|uniref:O-antigen ligase family protein n=1 Tax=Qipengyuania sp. GPGPB31 TaxID=3023518 RepID=UPI003134407B